MLDADIRGFFDNKSHEWTMKFVEHRVADRRVFTSDPKMAEGGSVRGRELVKDRDRVSALNAPCNPDNVQHIAITVCGFGPFGENYICLREVLLRGRLSS
jgi:hypothetical protein